MVSEPCFPRERLLATYCRDLWTPRNVSQKRHGPCFPWEEDVWQKSESHSQAGLAKSSQTLLSRSLETLVAEKCPLSTQWTLLPTSAPCEPRRHPIHTRRHLRDTSTDDDHSNDKNCGNEDQDHWKTGSIHSWENSPPQWSNELCIIIACPCLMTAKS